MTFDDGFGSGELTDRDRSFHQAGHQLMIRLLHWEDNDDVGLDRCLLTGALNLRSPVRSMRAFVRAGRDAYRPVSDADLAKHTERADLRDFLQIAIAGSVAESVATLGHPSVDVYDMFSKDIRASQYVASKLVR